MVLLLGAVAVSQKAKRLVGNQYVFIFIYYMEIFLY